MHSTRWSPDHALPTAAHRGPGSGQSPPGDTREKAMGQQRRRPEAGEGCFNQASQEDVLEEVTTGPPPATFASVRGRSRSKSSKARKRFPRPGNSATSAPRPGPRHPRAPFPFRGPRPPTRASAHISSLENLLPGSNSANRGGGTNHQSEFSFKIRTCGAVRSAGGGEARGRGGGRGGSPLSAGNGPARGGPRAAGSARAAGDEPGDLSRAMRAILGH